MRLIDRKSDRDHGGVFLYSPRVRIIPIICALGGRTGLAEPSRERIVCRAEFFAGPATAATIYDGPAAGEGGGEKKYKVNGRGRTDRCNPGRKIY
jgi:hypothetical protein